MMRVLIILVILASWLFFFSGTKIDPDLWGHLQFGQDILEKSSVPRSDYYSYSSYGAPWVNHEWLAETIFFLIFKTTGGAGLVVFKLLAALAITGLIYASVTAGTRSVFLRLLFIFSSLSVISYGFAIRPQIFTYLFFTLTVFLLDRFERTTQARLLYAVPVVFLFWCNLHGGFAAGMCVLVFYALCRIFEKRPSKPLVFITLCSAAVSLINPYGAGLWNFISQSLSKHRAYILEWGRVGFSFQYIDYFIIALLVLSGIIFSRAKRSLFEMSVLLFAFLISFQHNRHIVLFAITAAIYAPKYFDSFSNTGLMRLESRLSRSFFILTFLCLALILSCSAFRVGTKAFLQIEIPKDEYPVDAMAFLKSNRIGGNIFPWFDWGQMCIRELPGSKVFFDGRYETVYSDSLIQGYYDVLYGRRDYKKYLSRFPETDILFLHRDNPLASSLLQDREWIMVYLSPLAVVYLRNNQHNKRSIEDFINKRFVYPHTKPPYYLE